MKTLTNLLAGSVSQHIWAKPKSQESMPQPFAQDMTPPSTALDVRKHFPGFPTLSIVLVFVTAETRTTAEQPSILMKN
jgi:hypothetical protein